MDVLAGIPWWVIVLAVIGIYGMVIEGMKLFLAYGQKTGEPYSHEIPPVRDPEFFEMLSLLLNAQKRKGGQWELLNNGAEFTPRFLEDMRNARESIHLMTYIWRPSEMSDQIIDVLMQKAREGLQVRVMIDGIGGITGPRKRFREMQRAGVILSWFHPFTSAHLIHFNRRNHRRAFVIDGKIGYTGGISVARHWEGNAETPDSWRDTMIRVTGAMARTLQVAFMQLWSNVNGEVFSGQDVFPRLNPDEDGPLHFGLASSPAPEAQPLQLLYWTAFEAAEDTLYITNSYFAPDEYIRKVLFRKAREGVDVRVLLPGKYIDYRPLQYASRFHYRKFLEAGVRIFEYQPTMIHSKQLVVDDRFVIIGSANIDIRSVSLNQENVLCLYDEPAAAATKQLILKDMEDAVEIKLDEWKKRGLWRRAMERLAYLFFALY